MDKQQVESIYDYWKNIDLLKIKNDLDIVAAELTSRQDDSEVSRRKLVEMSRELKKTLPTESMDSVIPLIKNFQSEIDCLSRRSKMAEAAFLSVYRQFIDLRDPLPAIQFSRNHNTSDDAQRQEQVNRPEESQIPSVTEGMLEDERALNGIGKCCHLQDTYLTMAKRLREAEHQIISLNGALAKESRTQEMTHRHNSPSSPGQTLTEDPSTYKDVSDEPMDVIDAKKNHYQIYHEIKSLLINSSNSNCTPKETCEKEISPDFSLVEDLSKHRECNSVPSAQFHQPPATSPSIDTTMKSLKTTDDVRLDDVIPNGNGVNLPPTVQNQSAVHTSKHRKKPSPNQINSCNNILTGGSGRTSIDHFTTELVLDTADVAQQVREILSVNNIGQRLFARHVLGLSQGTVSELLSKPKHWDKLTEKGRESYRRMHQWVRDGGNIAVLKAYAPKKGSSVVLTGCDQDSAATEERISQILSEAQEAMMNKQTSDQVESAGSIVACIYRQELARIQQQQHEPDTSVGTETSSRQLATHRRRNEVIRSRKHSHNQPQQIQQPSASDVKDSLTHDIVARIYREELSKLAEAAEASGNVEELTVYRRELERLMTSEQTTKTMDNNMPWNMSTTSIDEHRKVSKSDIGSSSAGDFSGVKCELSQSPSNTSCTSSSMSSVDYISDLPQDLRVVRKESSSPGPCVQSFNQLDSPTTESGRRTGSAFTLVQPRGGARSAALDGSTTSSPTNVTESTVMMSPLQQMQSIANLLLPKQSQQRPLRAVLPPISQEQIDRYTDINTDDLVRRVKDALSQYSISQRLFGETVLGLSQGSVSDLLARPKPWHLLTQKGREPFIRMQIFLEDEAAVSRLVASQYQIPADKFLRTALSSGSCAPNCVTPAVMSQDEFRGGVAGPFPSPPSPTLAGIMSGDMDKPSPSSTPLIDSMRPLSLINHSIEHKFLDSSSSSSSRGPDATQSVGLSLPMWRDDSILPRPTTLSQQPVPSLHPTLTMMPPFFPLTPATAAAFFHPAATSIFVDLQQRYNNFNNTVVTGDSAMTPQSMTSSDSTTSANEMDTLEMTTQIKEVLQFHNLGQKLFGEAVLGLSQGSVSELLSKPKPWRMLSVKGREPFVKMAAWLADPLSVNRLRVYQDQHKARGKRRPSSADDSDCSQNTSMQTLTPPVNKKPRVFFTDDQKAALRDAYLRDSYPNQHTLDKLANDLGVGTKTVVNWFHNHRMRAKQHQQHQQQQLQQSSDDVSSPQSGADSHNIVKSHVTLNGQSEDIDRPTSSDDEAEEEDDLALSSDEIGDDAKINSATKRETTTPAVNCDDNDNVDIMSNYVAVAKQQQQQQIWANNRRRKSARPQWHYEGTVLDRSQRVTPGNGDVSQSVTECTYTSSLRDVNSDSCCDVTGKEYVKDIVSPLSPSPDKDIDRLFSRTTDIADFKQTDSALGSNSEQLLVVAGGNTW